MTKRVLVSKNELKSLYLKDNFVPYLHMLLRILLLSFSFIAFYVAYNSEHYLLSWLFFIGYSFQVSFLGWSGIGHELLHGTVFKYKKINNFFLDLFSMMLWINREYHKISHKIHHVYTMKTGVDFEFNPNQKTMSLSEFLLTFIFDINSIKRNLTNTIKNSVGTIPGDFAEKYVNHNINVKSRVVFQARKILIFHFLLNLLGFFTGGIIYSLAFSLAPFVATGPSRLLALSQHYKLENDVDDFSRNSRSIEIPYIIEFLYSNMNYHIEHHMYPGVPYYNLRKLHVILKSKLPQPVALADIFAWIK